MLGAYDYTLRYKPGPQHGNADMLPVDPAPTSVPEPTEHILCCQLHPLQLLRSSNGQGEIPP